MIVKHRVDFTDVYYFDGQTVRHVILYGRMDLREVEISALDLVESTYRSDTRARTIFCCPN